MKISKLATMTEQELTEHFIVLFLQGNGPSDEETILKGIKELNGYLVGALLLEQVSDGVVECSWKDNQMMFKAVKQL